MSQILKHPFFLNLNKKRLSFLKKILIIFKINLLVITLFTSSAQATTSFVDSFSVAAQETSPSPKDGFTRLDLQYAINRYQNLSFKR